MMFFKNKCSRLLVYTCLYVVTLCFCVSSFAATFVQPDGGVIDNSRVELTRPIVPDNNIALSRPLPLINDITQDSGKKIKLSTITLSGNTVFSSTQLLTVIAAQLDKEHSISSLQNIAILLTRHYRKNGYLMATAYVPAQTIDNETLRIAILEGYLDTITVGSESRFSKITLKKYFQKLQSDPLQSKSLERQLRLLTDRDVRTQLTFSPSEQQGATSLHIDTSDPPLLTGRVSLDNKGNRFTSEYRAGAVIEIASPFGRGGRYVISAISSAEKYRYFELDAEIPIGYNGLAFNFNVSDTYYALGKEFADLDAKGDSTSYKLGLMYPLERSLKNNIYTEINYRQGNFLDGSLAINTSDRDIQAVEASIYGDNTQKNKRLYWDLKATIGNADDQIQVDPAEGVFKKVEASLSQRYYVNNNFSLFFFSARPVSCVKLTQC